MWWCTYGPDWQAARVVDEFSGTIDNGFTCGPAANANLWANIHASRPTPSLVDTVTRRDTSMGLFDRGQTIYDVWQSYLRGWHWPASHLIYDPYNASTYGVGSLTSALERVGSSRNGGIIVEVSKAYNLPFNEPGVQYHFVVLMGYDSTTGLVLVGNADREPLPHGTGAPDWYAVGSLAAGGVVGIVSVLGHPMSDTIPTGWTDDGTTLKGPNGVPVIAGFRTYVLSHSWDPADVPLAIEETNVTPLEYCNPGLGGGSLQYFLKSTLEWRSSDGIVYPMYQGRELETCRQMIAGAQSALKAKP